MNSEFLQISKFKSVRDVNNSKRVFYKILTFCSRLRVTNKIIAQQKNRNVPTQGIVSSEIWREGSVKHLTKPASLPLSVTFLGRDWRKGGDLRLTQRNGPRPPSEPRVRLSRGFFLKDPTITMTFEKLQSSIWAMSKGCLKVFFLETSISSYLGVEHSRHCLFLKKWSLRIYGCIQCQE